MTLLKHPVCFRSRLLPCSGETTNHKPWNKTDQKCSTHINVIAF